MSAERQRKPATPAGAKKQAIHLRLTERLLGRLDKEARRRGLSRTSLVELRLERDLETHPSR